MKIRPPELIVFGGTFDPPHLGHRLLIEAAARIFPDAKIMVVPNPATPLVRGQLKAGISAGFYDRLTMCGLAFEDLRPAVKLEISDIESQIGPPHYTIRVLQHLTSESPSTRIAFLMGQDQVLSFDQWQDPKKILALCDLIVVARKIHPDLAAPTVLSTDVTDLLGRMGVVAVQEKGLFELSDYGRVIYLAEEPVSDAQSSLLRSENEGMKRDSRGWLSPAVREYIAQHKLYQVSHNVR